MSFIVAGAAFSFAMCIVWLSAATTPWKYERPFRINVAVLGFVLALAIASTHWIGW